MPQIQTKSVTIEYDEFGAADAPVIILIMGLGTQMVAWPEPFCQLLADQGFRVIRFDNRDIGLSEKLENAKTISVPLLVLLNKTRIPWCYGYTLDDMAEDTVNLMDALAIEQAHIVGASMGGMIAQQMAAHYPNRLLSLTSIMSTTGNRALPKATSEAQRALLNRKPAKGREGMIDYGVRFWQTVGSPGYPQPVEVLRETVATYIDRSFYPVGFLRQLGAVVASGDRRKALRTITTPTLVIHGIDDPLVPCEGGLDTKRNIPHSRLELIAGMGHDVPPGLFETLTGMITDHARTSVA